MNHFLPSDKKAIVKTKIIKGSPMKRFLNHKKALHLLSDCLRIFVILGFILFPTSMAFAKADTTIRTSIIQNGTQTSLPSFEQTSDQLNSFAAPLIVENPSMSAVNESGPIAPSKFDPLKLSDENVSSFSPDSKTDQIIIKYKEVQVQSNGIDPTSEEQIHRLSSSVGLTLAYVREMSGDSHVLRLPNKMSSTALQVIIEKLNALPEVEYAEPDFIRQHTFVPSDPYYSSQWGYFSPTPGNYGINAPAAWDITTGSPSVIVAVVDTGITGHSEFSGRIVPGFDFIADNLVANDGNGRDSDPSDPGDWITSAENASGYFAGCEVSNSSWHGTHVAGTIAASSNNGNGVSGINWNSKILPVRVLGKCGGYDSDIIDGMRWAAGLSVSGVPVNSNPAKVINMSIGGEGSCPSSYQTAINEITATGTTIVVAAGNENNNASLYTPGNCNGVITVAATDRNGNRSFYSNYGSAVEISAPGGDTTNSSTNGILSTVNSGTQGPVADAYAYYQGTSMATPHVSGIVSLLYSMNPSYTPSQILSILQNNATAFPTGSSCSTSACGTGIVNAGAAVSAAVPQAPAQFVKNSPINGATNQPRNLTLGWGTSAQATSYQYCMDTTNDNTCATWVDNGTSTSITFTGLNANTTYYWQVRAINSVGTTPANGSETAFWSFTTGTDLINPTSYGVYLPLILRAEQNPAAFNKSSPANTATNQSISPILSWQSTSPVTLYEYCYDTTNDGTCSTWISNGTATSVQLPVLQANTSYFWQVRAWNGTAGPVYANGSLSAFWKFTTSVIQNPIQNGGFESGDVVWTEISTNGWDLIVNTTQSLPLSPHNGSWLSWLGGDANETSQISQTVTIPAGRSILHFWLYTASEDTCGYDAFGVFIGSDVVYSQWVCDSNDTNGWVHKTVDLTSYAGQTKEIKFLAGLDSALNSNVWVDDVSLEATTSLSYSMSGNVILDRSDLDPTSLAGIEMIKENRFRDTAIPDASYTDKHEESDLFAREISILKNHLLTE
jgi:serine protease